MATATFAVKLLLDVMIREPCYSRMLHTSLSAVLMQVCTLSALSQMSSHLSAHDEQDSLPLSC